LKNIEFIFRVAKNNMHRVIKIVVSITLLPIGCHSQQAFTHHNYEGYAQILQMAQDSMGFLWVEGTTFGKYDGYHITSYHDGDGDKLYGWPVIDQKGNICIVSFLHNQITSYQRETDSFINYYPDVGGAQINQIGFEPDGKLWIGTIEAGLFLFDPKTNAIQNFYNAIPDSAKQSSSNLIITLHVFDGYLLLGTSLGLWKFDKISGKFSRPITQQEESSLLYQRPIRRIFSYTDHFWFYLPDRLVKTDLMMGILQQFMLPGDVDISTMSRFNIDRDDSGVFWLATYGQGLLSFDPSTKKLNRYRHDSANKYSIASDVLQSVLVDREQNIWIGTFNYGFDQLKKQSIVFYEAYLPNQVPPTVSSIINTSQGNYILQESKSDGLYVALLADLESIQFHPMVTNPGMKGVISTHSTLGKDFWWVGTWNNGFYGIPIDKKTGLPHSNDLVHYTNNPDNPNTIPENKAGVWLEDDEGNLWITSPQNALHKINRALPHGKEGSVIAFTHNENDPASISKGNIWGVMRADRNKVWVLTSFALDLFDGKAFKAVYKLNNEKGENFCMEKAKDGDIIIGGMNGLIIGKKNNDQYDFEVVEQFKEKTIFSLEVDKEDRIWAAGENGLFCYDRKSDRLLQFKEEDGLSSNEFNANSSTKTPDGILIFSNSNGLTLFDPSTLKLSATQPSPVLTQLMVNNKFVDIQNARSSNGPTSFSIPKHINTLSELVLEYNHRIFSIEFAAMELVSPEKNIYQYQLEGFDEDWIQTDWTNRSAHYTNLDAGNYTFKVRAANHDGIWNDHVTSLPIRILPPPWKTWWAYTSYGLIFIGILYTARKNIIQRERLKSKLRVEQIEHEKEHFELEKVKEIDRIKTSFFTNISHEFRTPLTLIKGPVQDLMEEYANHPKTRERLKLIQRNSDLLLKLINQLLDLAKLESGSLKIEKSEGDLTVFIGAVSRSFSSLAQNKNITFSVELPEEHFHALFDKDKLETILINLINNAIKFTPEGGSVTVKARVEKSNLLLSVKDTGIGVPEDQQKAIFERFHQVSEAHQEVGTGIGLALVKELVALMGGTIEVKSKVGEGSMFGIMLPIEIGETVAGYQLPVTGEEVLSSDSEQPETGDRQPATELTLKEDEAPAKPHILIVEDNTDLRAFIIDSLGNEFHFLEAADGKQGLDKAIENVPDLIVSDVMMPEMDGITMAGKLKSDVRTSHIPIIILTAKSTEESKLSGLQKGADDYLTKPFNKQELLLKVRNGVMSRMKLREKIRLELMKEAPKIEVASADEQFLMKVKEAIHQRLSDEQLSVESVAEEIGLSRAQLYRKVTALTGVSVNELIRSFRLKKAAQLLEQNWGPVSQVAYEVGYSNLSYFSKVFKEEFGVLPSEYAHKAQGLP